MSVEDAFAKLTGRQATQEERERLYRLRDALGLRDNDAFWSIVMALEYYDSFWRAYPAQFAKQAADTIERARAAFAAAAEKEAAEAQRTLSAQVAEASVAIARRLADRPIGVHRVTLMLAAAVAFGALCVHAGSDLAPIDEPLRRGHGSDLSGIERAVAGVLSVPAGWMVFALLLPTAGYGVKAGWDMAADPLAGRGDKAIGWCVAALCALGVVACAALVAKWT
ncbi:MAG: hypothetical protein ABSC94_26680 [Polyangiaceae bacterium]|jgi:hypothetical protein